MSGTKQASLARLPGLLALVVALGIALGACVDQGESSPEELGLTTTTTTTTATTTTEQPLPTGPEPIFPTVVDQEGSSHTRRITEIVALPDGSVASASIEGPIQVWRTGEPGRVNLEGHDGPIRDLAALRDGRIASAGADGTVQLWDPDQPAAPVATFVGHSEEVLAVVELPDGRIASGGEDDNFFVWDPNELEAEPLTFAQTVFDFAVLPDGQLVAASRTENTVRIWDVGQPSTPVASFSGHRYVVRAVAALADGRVASAGEDQVILVWDPANLDSAPVALVGHTEFVFNLTSLQDGRIASAGADGLVRIWDVEQPNLPVAVFDEHDSSATAVTQLPSGLMVSGERSGRTLVWEPEVTDSSITAVSPDLRPRFPSASLADGRIVSNSPSGFIALWDPEIPDLPQTLPFLRQLGPNFLGLSDGRFVTYGDDQIWVWDPDQLQAEPRGITAPNGRLFDIADGQVAIAAEGQPIQVVDVDDPASGPIVLADTIGVNVITRLEDGRFSTSGPGRSIAIWDPNRLDEPRFSLPETQGMTLVELSNNRVATFSEGRASGPIHVWRLDNPSTPEITINESFDIGFITPLTGDRLLITDSGSGSGSGSGRALILPLQPNADPVDVPIRGVTPLVVELPDERIAVATFQATIEIWDPGLPQADPEIIGTNALRILEITVLSDGRIAGLVEDEQLRVWNVGFWDDPTLSAGR